MHSALRPLAGFGAAWPQEEWNYWQEEEDFGGERSIVEYPEKQSVSSLRAAIEGSLCQLSLVPLLTLIK